MRHLLSLNLALVALAACSGGWPDLSRPLPEIRPSAPITGGANQAPLPSTEAVTSDLEAKAAALRADIVAGWGAYHRAVAGIAKAEGEDRMSRYLDGEAALSRVARAVSALDVLSESAPGEALQKEAQEALHALAAAKDDLARYAPR